jgi:YD repeat-containing protein
LNISILVRFTYSSEEQPVTITDRLGGQTILTYHGSTGKIAKHLKP